jgi:hypothetical protein
LYIENAGEINFSDIKLKDLSLKYQPLEKSDTRYKAQQISDMYYAWSATAADFNNDGIMDVAAGPYVYYGPDYTKYREIYYGVAVSPSKEFTQVNCYYAYDFDKDGWMDILSGTPVARIYLNPKGKPMRWKEVQVIPGGVQTEVTVFRDIDGDGKPELVFGTNKDGVGLLKYAKFDPADPSKPWQISTISESGYFLAHGIGSGDINGDGKLDIINAFGWWEQPASLTTGGLWKYHPVAFGRYGHRGNAVGGSVMAVYDINGDGLNDVIAALNAHGFGLAWFEQKKNPNGESTFERHIILDDYAYNNPGGVVISELHGSTFADIDGDGVPDFITGKRYFSHIDSYLDPDPYGPPVLYVFRTVRDAKAPGGARFVPELVHNRSGTGSDVATADLDKDGDIDIISSTNRGTFIFWNQTIK